MRKYDLQLKILFVIFIDEKNQLIVVAKDEAVRFLLFSGKPIGEPVAWNGSIVMNRLEELKIAFEEYNSETFIKHSK